jgi:hypothetical protein
MGERRKMKTLFKTPPKRGSALLIVLGFLSFMMISAVSFAIYMRIERQASSNYRHTITSRHMLNAALYRAIDEIDSDLRDSSVSSAYKKFPYQWKYRVRPSALESSDALDQKADDARVLSLEALSFIPGILVNDVRRYAIRAEADQAYMGAKWRKLSMPVRSMGDESGTTESADGAAVIGRYAYVCVNVSDMLDANTCRASIRNANTNHVSVAHLFDAQQEPDTQREAYDDNYRTKDIRYETLQDFYACMSKLSDNPFGSPYHKWMGQTGPNAGSEFSAADKHVLIADSKVLAEPSNNASFNLFKLQPSQITDAFVQKLDEALTDVTIPNASYTAVKAMLTDYIDEDSKPTNLNVPSVEMVPMISQITFVPMGAATAQIMTRDISTAAEPGKQMYYLKVGTDEMYGNLVVETVWPFQNYQARTPTVDPNTFKVQVQAYVKISSLNADRFHTTMEFMPPGGPVESQQYYKLSPTVSEPLSFNSKLTPNDQDGKINDFYYQLPINLGPFSKAVDIIDSKGNQQSIFTKDEFLSVALIVFVQILDADGTVVDQSPKTFDGTTATVSGDEFMLTPKIFFETNRQKISDTMAAGNLMYQWKALEVPDPRFNYKASNWVQWKANTAVSGATEPSTPGSIAFINASTSALLGKKGRDSDIFMSVADSGYFQSPGELGFIVRPFDFNIAGSPCDFSDPARTAEDADDANRDFMFRTIRIYDHTQTYPKDNIYGCFTAMKPDGSLNGARVNPLSDIDKVLEAAIAKTPFDYWQSAHMETETDVTKLKAFGKETYSSDENAKNSERTIFTKAQWQTFTEAWIKHFKTARSTQVATSADGSKTINESWMVHLRDVYGLYNTLGWHEVDGDTMKIFQSSLALDFPLHEIDRKMLYSFSLDSFSDRQQLFLYFLRAEAMPPGLGASAATGGGQSLAGGRAVALVWRDPYPVGYNLEDNTGTKNCSSYGSFEYNVESPWVQYGATGTRNTTEASKKQTLHDHQILFFKQLGN